MQKKDRDNGKPRWWFWWSVVSRSVLVVIIIIYWWGQVKKRIQKIPIQITCSFCSNSFFQLVTIILSSLQNHALLPTCWPDDFYARIFSRGCLRMCSNWIKKIKVHIYYLLETALSIKLPSSTFCLRLFGICKFHYLEIRSSISLKFLIEKSERAENVFSSRWKCIATPVWFLITVWNMFSILLNYV